MVDTTVKVTLISLLNIIPQFTEIVNRLFNNLLTVAVTVDTTDKFL